MLEHSQDFLQEHVLVPLAGEQTEQNVEVSSANVLKIL